MKLFGVFISIITCFIFILLGFLFSSQISDIRAYMSFTHKPSFIIYDYYKTIKDKKALFDTLMLDAKTFLAVKQENEILKSKLNEQKLNIARLRWLEKTLNVYKNYYKKPITTTLINGPTFGFSSSIWVKAGTKNGVSVNDAVVSNNGLIGKVVLADYAQSQVLLLNDYGFRLPVRVVETNANLLLKGSETNFDIILTEDYNPNLKEGQLVVTSGVGGVFESDILVGSVIKVGENYKIKPFADTKNLYYVTILLNKNKED